VLVNGFPTGSRSAMPWVHGGPYPASTQLCATSVGGKKKNPMAIRRFLRTVVVPETCRGAACRRPARGIGHERRHDRPVAVLDRDADDMAG